MGDGHDCTCAEPQAIMTYDERAVCVECGGTIRSPDNNDSDEEEQEDER